MGIRKFEFVSKTQFLSLLFTLNFCWSKSPKKQGNIFLFANWIIQKTPQSIFGIIYTVMFPEYPDIYNFTQEIKATFNCKFLIQNNNNKTVGHFLCLAILEKYDMI